MQSDLIFIAHSIVNFSHLPVESLVTVKSSSFTKWARLALLDSKSLNLIRKLLGVDRQMDQRRNFKMISNWHRDGARKG